VSKPNSNQTHGAEKFRHAPINRKPINITAQPPWQRSVYRISRTLHHVADDWDDRRRAFIRRPGDAGCGAIKNAVFGLRQSRLALRLAGVTKRGREASTTQTCTAQRLAYYVADRERSCRVFHDGPPESARQSRPCSLTDSVRVLNTPVARVQGSPKARCRVRFDDLTVSTSAVGYVLRRHVRSEYQIRWPVAGELT